MTTIPPDIMRKRSSVVATRIAVKPNSSLNTQKGMPMVKLKKNGRWKNFRIISPSFLSGTASFLLVFSDMISAGL
jgi:hypothetical protein